MIFQALVLVCSINTPVQQCNEITALQTFQSSVFENEMFCSQYQSEAQLSLAKSPIKFDISKEYIKSICHRIKTT